MKATHILTRIDGARIMVHYDKGCELFVKSGDEGIAYSQDEFHSLIPIAEEEKEEPPEILDWTTAAVLWGQGVEIQADDFNNGWVNVNDKEQVFFQVKRAYRRKPVEPVIVKIYECLGAGGTWCFSFATLDECTKNFPNALAYLELTYSDGKPTGARIVP